MADASPDEIRGMGMSANADNVVVIGAGINGHTHRYALGASALGLMPDFFFRETGLADRLETFVPDHPKRVYFPDPDASVWIHRDPIELERELRERWGERGEVAGFRADEGKVVAYLQEGYRTATPPNVATARQRLGETLTRPNGSNESDGWVMVMVPR
jgi:hypothetical protein